MTENYYSSLLLINLVKENCYGRGELIPNPFENGLI